MSAHLNILLVEDDVDLSATLIDYLSFLNISCDHAANGRSGLNLALSNEYDVIVLDVSLPKLNGLDVCSKLRNAGSNIPILMLTARDSLDDKLSGFNAGTDDYLTKPFASEELIARVRALAGRQSSQVKTKYIGSLVIDYHNQSAYKNDQRLSLTPIEWSLLESLSRASPGTLTRPQLAHAIWGDETPDSNSLNVHLHNLRQIVDADADQPLIESIKGRGVRMRSDDEY
ncbi:MAG: response regulator transcription factor [Pseudomonadota bacterium]